MVAETTPSDLRTKQAESRSEFAMRNLEPSGVQQQLRAENVQKAAAQAKLTQTRAPLKELSSVL